MELLSFPAEDEEKASGGDFLLFPRDEEDLLRDLCFLLKSCSTADLLEPFPRDENLFFPSCSC